MSARWPKRLVASLVIGLVITSGLATLAAFRPYLTPQAVWYGVEAADFREDGDSQSGITWARTHGLDILRTYRSRNVLRTGLPFVQAKERLAQWDGESVYERWSKPLEAPWNEEEAVTVYSGWPFRAFVGSTVFRRDLDHNTTESVDDGGFSLAGRRTLVPYRIVPIGFVLDILLWSAFVFGWWTFLTAWRIRARRKHRQCVACGHALAPQQADCPECGGEQGRAASPAR